MSGQTMDSVDAELPEGGTAAPAAPAGVRAGWEHWKKIARAVGVVQTKVLMVLFYFFLVLPVGLVMRVRADPLHLRPRAGGNWLPHRVETPSLDNVRRQF